MPQILAENLSGKAVTGADGAELGMLYNITMDGATGSLRNLVVEPNEVTERETDFDDDGDQEVIVATSTKEIVTYDLRTGREEFRHGLTSYGYSKPLVADILPAEGKRNRPH